MIVTPRLGSQQQRLQMTVTTRVQLERRLKAVTTSADHGDPERSTHHLRGTMFELTRTANRHCRHSSHWSELPNLT